MPFCRKCKSFRNFCKRADCPMLAEALRESSPKLVLSGDISSVTPPGVFIGSYNYPKVYAGPMAVGDLSSPYPTGKEYGMGIEDILKLGRNVYRASRTTAVKDVGSPFTRSIQESAMASRFVDIEMNVSGSLGSHLDHEARNEGPVTSMVRIDSLRMASNPLVPRKVDYFYSDTDLKAQKAVWMLYDSGFPVGYLEGVLSSGALGVGRNRRLVPTRWSITAVDDIIYRNIKQEILTYEPVSEIMAFYCKYLGNSFTVLLLPYAFAFEMQEMWGESSGTVNEGSVMLDYELSSGRKRYADQVGGAYYAARLAVMEYLRKIRRQASAIVLRTVGNEYYSPLGVWVIRETVREAMRKGPSRYATIEELTANVRAGIGNWSSRSRVLRERTRQRSIMDFA